MKIVENDSWLKPFSMVIDRRYQYFLEKEKELITDNRNLQAFANGHLYFGVHKGANEWIIREWMPNAIFVYLIGDFNNWQSDAKYEFKKLENGVWELKLSLDSIKHQDQYKLHVVWNQGAGERIPAWCNRTIQDQETKLFNAQIWAPDKPHKWKADSPKMTERIPYIYEAHIGMGTEEYKVGSYTEFRKNILPRIIEGGYNTLQLMAIQEHPYYGSFGYHVSNLFAASSRFGTPDELKELIDKAHENGIAVIMDLVHSHAVKNELEGLGMYAGDPGQFFHSNSRREHVAWDSLCYDYRKNEVLHFLLSNIQFWLTEYNFDGFRFDGITSMLYLDHGLERAFTSYENYFDGGQDEDAICYLTLANKLINEIKPGAISIAEDMSGYPGIASPINSGGMGFTHRLAMGIPDYWIKSIKDKTDEEWNMGELFHELTSKRSDEQVVAYAESHDQALVGDKTLIFRLIDKDMYWHMDKSSENLIVDRGIALHKMIRLITLSTAGGGYLNFMGNEFGHPEWIDFPREGNDWSYQHARRQWSLADNKELKYYFLGDFDKQIINFAKENKLLRDPCDAVKIDEGDKIIAFTRNKYLFVFNFHPTNSYEGYGLKVDPGKYRCIFSTDENRFGGFNRIDCSIIHRTNIEQSYGHKHSLNLYIPSRTAQILERIPVPKLH